MGVGTYIRFARTRDMQRAAKVLERELFPHTEPYDPEEGLWWLAFDSEGPCGFACLRPMGEHGFAFLARCGVLKRARGKRLQTRFIKLRERKTKALGLGQIVTYTAPCNHASSNNLIRCGYLLYNPRYKYGVRGALYFYKDL